MCSYLQHQHKKPEVGHKPVTAELRGLDQVDPRISLVSPSSQLGIPGSLRDCLKKQGGER